MIEAFPLGEHLPVNRTHNTTQMQGVVSQGSRATKPAMNHGILNDVASLNATEKQGNNNDSDPRSLSDYRGYWGNDATADVAAQASCLSALNGPVNGLHNIRNSSGTSLIISNNYRIVLINYGLILNAVAP